MSLSSVRPGLGGGFNAEPDQGLYPISVVTELTGLTAPTLRGYERAGLLTPARTDGGSRRYSDNDLARLRRIAALASDGVNLAGMGRILALEAELAQIRADNERPRRAAGGGRRTGTKPSGA
jgi:DNA-binding transcriptional MerR regulator